MSLPARYTELHYMPNTQGEARRGKPLQHAYKHRIAYTMTRRGLQDEIPTLLFIGAPFELLCDACRDIYKMMDGAVCDLTVSYEHSCRVRNGKQYWRVAVGIVGLDERFLSLAEFVTLLVSHIKRICNCVVRRYKTETFLNL
jgi:hypothetical protein